MKRKNQIILILIFIHMHIYMFRGKTCSLNLPYSEGLDTQEAVIPLFKVMQRAKLGRGKLQCAFETDRNWFSVVLFYQGIPVCTIFPCLCLFPLHRHIFLDCLRKFAFTFGIGLLLLMGKNNWYRMYLICINLSYLYWTSCMLCHQSYTIKNVIKHEFKFPNNFRLVIIKFSLPSSRPLFLY